MYSPEAFSSHDQAVADHIITQNPFAALVSSTTDYPLISHIPINRLAGGQLHGHLAKPNPQSSISDGSPVTAVFSGPHAYISPRYYASTSNVPTWNYAVVHVSGRLRWIDDQYEVWELFQAMTTLHEGPDGWQIPDKKAFRSMLGAIRMFAITEESIQTKVKFNQNKNPDDIRSVITALEQQAPAVAKYMATINRDKLPES
jgi:transcriptional regulator